MGDMMIETMVEAVVPAVIALVGAACGAQFVKSKEKAFRRRDEIIQAYSAFFRAYAEYMANHTVECRGRVVATLEVARLIMPKEAGLLFKEFENNFIQTPDNFGSRAEILNRIRSQCFNDIAKL